MAYIKRERKRERTEHRETDRKTEKTDKQTHNVQAEKAESKTDNRGTVIKRQRHNTAIPVLYLRVYRDLKREYI